MIQTNFTILIIRVNILARLTVETPCFLWYVSFKIVNYKNMCDYFMVLHVFVSPLTRLWCQSLDSTTFYCLAFSPGHSIYAALVELLSVEHSITQ